MVVVGGGGGVDGRGGTDGRGCQDGLSSKLMLLGRVWIFSGTMHRH